MNTGRSSLSSFRLLFSCCWTAESTEDEGSLLLNGGPPTYIPKQSDQITTIITTICSGMEKYRGWRGVSLYPTQSLLSDFWVKKKKEILPAELLVKVSYAISRHVGLEGRGGSIRYLHRGRTSHGLQGTDSWENHSKDWAPIKWVNV